MMPLQVKESVKVCRRCDLCKVGNGPVPFSGPAPSFLAVVGEAPGREEDAAGEPFVGRAGQVLRECMVAAGMHPDRVSFINAVSCFPDRTPKPSEVEACSDNLLAQLQVVNPVWVLMVGGVALSTIRPDLKISRTRGKVLQKDTHWKNFVTFHPSYAMRNPKAEEVLRRDLRTLVTMMRADPIDCGDGVTVPGWLHHTDDSCVRCGVDGEELADHDGWLRFDDWGAPYCNECWSQAPVVVEEVKARQKVEKIQVRSGKLFE